MRLELLPPVSARPRPAKPAMLFDVKAHLKDSTTPLEFKDVTFVANPTDDTTEHCIDYLSDTGWKVPRFAGRDSAHQLVFQLTEPVMIDGTDLFGITIDSGGSPETGKLSRIRLSFAESKPRCRGRSTPL